MKQRMASAKAQQIAKAKVAGFELGIRAGSVIAATLVQEGWKHLDKLPDEVCSRVTGKKLRFGGAQPLRR